MQPKEEMDVNKILKNFEQGVADGRASAKANRVDDGGPAFPSSQHDYDGSWSGMSLWDYYAAHALAGLCSPNNGDICWPPNGAAEVASLVADVMLAERAKRFGGES